MNFRRRYSGEKPSFQLTPMIDVVFLLLCFFVTTQMFAQWETSTDIQLPTSDTGNPPIRLPGEIVINITRQGTIVVNQRTLKPEELILILKEVIKQFPGQSVMIRADRYTPYLYVFKVMDICRKADIWNISFASEPADSDENSVE